MRSASGIKLWAFTDRSRKSHVPYQPLVDEGSVKDLKVLTKKFKRIERDIGEITNTQNTLRNLVQMPDIDITAVTSNLEKLQTELKDLKNEISDMSNARIELEDQLVDEMKSQIKNLSETLTREIDLINSTIQDLQTQISKNLEDFTLFVGLLQEVSNTLTGKISTLKELANVEIVKLQDKVGKLQDKVTKNNKDVGLLVKFTNAQLAKLKEDIKRIKFESGKIENIEKSLEGIGEKIKGVEEQLTDNSLTESHIEDFNKLKTYSKTQIKSLQEYIEDTRKTLLELIGKKSEEIKALEVANPESEDIVKLKTELEKQNVELESLKASLDDTKSKASQQKNKLDELVRKTEDFNWRNTVLNNKVSELKTDVYRDINLVRSDLSSDFVTKLERQKLVQETHSNSITNINNKLIETKELIDRVRESIHESVNDVSDELDSTISRLDDDIDSIKEDMSTLQTQSGSKSEILIQLFCKNFPMMPRRQKMPLHTGKNHYIFYTNGKLTKLVIQCTVVIQVFINDNLITVVNPEHPDVVNMNMDITEGDTMHFIPTGDYGKNLYVEAWLEKS